MSWITKQLIVLGTLFSVLLLNVYLEPANADTSGTVAASNLSILKAIEVSDKADSAVLLVKLSSPATYNSYKTTSPLRLVVDLSKTSQGELEPLIKLDKGNFKNVTVKQYNTDAGTLTRLEIELFKDVEPVLVISKENPGELQISFPLLANPVQQQADLKKSDEVNADKSNLDKVASASDKVQNGASVPQQQINSDNPSSANLINKLTSIATKNNIILLNINGTSFEYKTFRLNKPERFVVDLHNVKSDLVSKTFTLNTSGISTARIGVYRDKLRVVFDSSKPSLPEINVKNTTNGLSVIVNSGSLNSQDVQSNDVSKQPQASVKSDVQTVRKNDTSFASVEMIDFQVINSLSRVSIKASGGVQVAQPIKSAGFVTLTLKNVKLPRNLQRSIDTNAFNSPVLRVTPVIVKTRKGTDVIVRIALKRPAEFVFRQENDMLFIDFKHPATLLDNKTYQNEKSGFGRKKSANVDYEIGNELNSPSEISAKSYGTNKVYKGKRVTLEFADAEVRKIFQLLSEVSNKNFVLGDDVTGSISIKLVNVPWDQALDIILDAKGLDKKVDGNIVIIKGKGKFKSQAEEDFELKKKSTNIKSETFIVNYADIKDVETLFKPLKKSERGDIALDKRTNRVIVTDIPEAIEEMRKLLKQVDVPEKQVMIEARIVEATSTFTSSLGVSWGVHYANSTGTIFPGLAGVDTGFGGLTTAPPTSGVGTTSGMNTGISFGTLGTNVRLDMRLSAAATAGLIKIVSTPKVATLNNKSAKITQGQQVPYTSSTSDKVETKFVEAALSLEVTPHINSNGTISMKIDAKNDSVGSVTAGSTAPAINKKQATTEMLLRDGETTVIGGIYVDTDNETDEGVPYLMDIPLLGSLFKTNSKTKTKTELLIFITPRILNMN